MKALLVLGSDPSMVDAEGKTPFQHVKESSPDYNDIKELFDMFQYQDKGIFIFMFYQHILRMLSSYPLNLENHQQIQSCNSEKSEMMESDYN